MGKSFIGRIFPQFISTISLPFTSSAVDTYIHIMLVLILEESKRDLGSWELWTTTYGRRMKPIGLWIKLWTRIDELVIRSGNCTQKTSVHFCDGKQHGLWAHMSIFPRIDQGHPTQNHSVDLRKLSTIQHGQACFWSHRGKEGWGGVGWNFVRI